jgi:predicted nucleic acid-binding protein
VPDLAQIPSGTKVFVDTMIFYLHFQGRSVSCTAFIERIARGEIEAYVNTEVLSDLLHKLMLHEARQKGFIAAAANAKDLHEHLRRNRNAIGTMPEHQSQFEQTISGGIAVLQVTPKLLRDTKRERISHGLLTNDSIHLGNMLYKREPLADIATYDADFEHINDITVWKPTDVIVRIRSTK